MIGGYVWVNVGLEGEHVRKGTCGNLSVLSLDTCVLEARVAVNISMVNDAENKSCFEN